MKKIRKNLLLDFHWVSSQDSSCAFPMLSKDEKVSALKLELNLDDIEVQPSKVSLFQDSKQEK